MPQKKSVAPSKQAEAVKRTDPVDWASHYWEKHNLGDHQDAFLAMSSALRMNRIMTDAVESELKNHGLNLTDYLLLMTLELSETGTRLLSQMARTLLVHATTITLATDRLEAKKLLYRHAHPTDRRATLVSITDEGRKLILKATNDLKDINFGLTGSTPEQRRRFISMLASLRTAAGDDDRAH